MSNKTALKLLIFGWGVLLLMELILVGLWSSLPPQLPWFYSLPSGEQQLVNKMVLAGVFPAMALILGMTRILAAWTGKGDSPVETTLMAGELMAVGLLAASFFRVIAIFAL